MSQARIPNAAIWEALRAWVDSRESMERANGVSALTPAQAEVISDLIVVSERSDADERNYVAELNQHSQKRHAGSVDYYKEDHIPPGRFGGGGQWRIFCRLSWCNEVFPQPGFGFIEGQEPPSFPNKKLAKQFAAKMAMQYLHDRSSSLAGTALVSTTTTSSTSQNYGYGSTSGHLAKKTKRELPQTEEAATMAASGSTVKSSLAEQDCTSGGVLIEGDSPEIKEPQKEGTKIQAMVRQLAGRLNYKMPVYTVHEESNRPGFFRGEVVWPRESLAPEQPIRVDGLFGEAQAVEQLAAKTYEWLREQAGKREEDLAAIMEDIAQSQPSQGASG